MEGGHSEGPFSGIRQTIKLVKTGLAAPTADAFYSRIAPEYDTIYGEYPKVREITARYFSPPPTGTRGTFVDLGCGTGMSMLGVLTSPQQWQRVVGIDRNPDMLAQMPKHLTVVKHAWIKEGHPLGTAIDSFQRDITDTKLPDNFCDAAISMGALWHLPRGADARFAHEAARILKPHGRIVVPALVNSELHVLGPLGRSLGLEKKIRLGDFTSRYIAKILTEAGLHSRIETLSNHHEVVIADKQ